MIALYLPDDSLLIQVEVEDRSYRIREIMGEHALYLYFSLPEYIEIPPGTYTDFNGERYLLRKPDNFKKNHSRDFNYTIKLEPYSAILRDVKMKFFVGSNNTNFELEFPLVFQPINFLQLIVDNLNANDTGWATGDCIVAGEQLISFSNEFCDSALSKISESFNTEFEVVGKTIHLHKVERTDTALPLAYGKNLGFKPGLGRVNVDDSKVINRLYVISSDRNIDNTTYRANTLRLPVSYLTSANGFNYLTDAFGLYVERTDLTGRRVEESADLSYIYPKRVGTVSSVVAVDISKNFYNFYDTSIPVALDFSQYVVEGTTMTVVFQDGNLAGLEFEVQYIHLTREFRIVPKEVNGMTYPVSPDIPAIGDKYVVFNVMLPQTYIDAAEIELLTEALTLLQDAEKPRYSFAGVLDEVYATKNWATISSRINLGNLVSFSDNQFLTDPILIRITSVKEFVNKPKSPVIELSNNVTGKTFSETIASLRSELISGAYSSVLKNNLNLKDVFLFKNAPDTANEHIDFAKGLSAQQPIVAENGLEANAASIDQLTILSKMQSEVFGSGFLGSGFRLQNNAGNWDLEVDSLVVRKNMDVFQLTIQQIQSVGGQILLTPASMTCVRVEVLANTYKCYFNQDGGSVVNLFQANDQAICQQFDGLTQKRYWRLVTAVGIDFIELSKLDADGVGIPAKGDEIVQLGHRSNAARQSAIMISSYGDPKIEQYKGINGFTLAGKLVTRISPEGNIFKAAEFIVETAGGDQNLHTLIQANASEIQLRATQTSVNGLTGRVSDAEAAIVVQAGQISSKVTQTEVNAAQAAAIAAAALDATSKSNAAQSAAQTYAAAQATLAQTTASAYADGIVTDEEARAIADATAKSNAAQAAAIAAAALDATSKSNAAQSAAQTYAAAQATLAQTTASAYADGIVSDEEARAIADAQAKADAAKTAAIAAAAEDATAKVDAVKVGGRNLLVDSIAMSGFIKGSTTASIGTTNNLNPFGQLTATLLTLTNTSGAFDYYRTYNNLLIGTAYTLSVWVKLGTASNFVLTPNNSSAWNTINKQVQINTSGWQRLITSFIAPSTGKINIHIGSNLEAIVQSAGTIYIYGFKLEVGNIATDWTSAPEDVAADAQAKAYAAQSAAQIYAAAQATLAQTTANAYADGVVSDEEARAIADAQAKANAAQAAAIAAAAADATAKVAAVKVGARNLLKNSGKIVSKATYNLSDLFFGDFTPIAGETYTISMKITEGIDRSSFSLFSSGGYRFLASFQITEKDANGIFSKTFTMSYYSGRTPSDGYNYLSVYQNPSSAISSSILYWIKLEKGNKATDWTPAPEDVQANIDTAEYNAKTYADAQFIEKTVYDSEIVQLSNSISSKVTQTAYDANNVVIGQQMTAIEQTAESLSLKLYDSVNQNRGRLNKVRYFRNYLGENTEDSRAQWVELQCIDINNVNVALGKSAICRKTSDGTLVALDYPARVTDGSINNTLYAQAAVFGFVYVEIDLGSVYALRDIKMWHLQGLMYYDNKVEVSEDGIAWYPVFDSTIEGYYNETAAGFTIQNPYVYEAGKAMLPTGIDIVNRVISLTADNTFFKANDGTQIAAFTIKDGKPLLKAENIDVENMVAKVLQTQASGARVEINGISNSIVIYDSADNPKILFTPKLVMSEASIATTGLVSTTYVARSAGLTAPGTVIMYAPEQVVISDEKNYSISTPAITYSMESTKQPLSFTSCSIKIALIEVTSGREIVIGNASLVSVTDGVTVNQNSTRAITKISGMTTGTYKMEITLTVEGEVSSVGCSIAAGQIIKAEAMIAYQEIGIDGFNFINSATDYVHNASGNLSIKKGTKTFKVTSSGVYINGILHN